MLESDEILALPSLDDVAADSRAVDEVVAGNAESAAAAAAAQGGILVDGDMIVTPEQYGRFFDDNDGKTSGFAGSGLKDESQFLSSRDEATLYGCVRPSVGSLALLFPEKNVSNALSFIRNSVYFFANATAVT